MKSEDGVLKRKYSRSVENPRVYYVIENFGTRISSVDLLYVVDDTKYDIVCIIWISL